MSIVCVYLGDSVQYLTMNAQDKVFAEKERSVRGDDYRVLQGFVINFKSKSHQSGILFFF